MKKKPFRCEVTGRVCPLDIIDFSDYDMFDLAEMCPIKEYRTMTRIRKKENELEMIICDCCEHAINREIKEECKK
jgi:hypothetical protein